VTPNERALRRRRRATALTYAILVVIAIGYIYPFLINIATSFKSDPDAAT